jgi:uncharacterized membrane protein YfcA
MIELITFILVGFVAQIVDGTVGMAYGVVSTTALLAAGVSPLRATANIHFAELATTAMTSGFHLRRGNVSWGVVRTLAIAGGIGGLVGASLLVILTPLNATRVRNVVAVYLLILGLWLIRRAIRPGQPKEYRTGRAVKFGLLGGTFDAMGGGWGPIVTSNLVMSGLKPRVAVGSSIVAEFMVTVVHSAVFAGFGDLRPDRVMLGLLIGGLVAAPIGPHLASRLPARTMILGVGSVVVISSILLLLR